MPVGRFLVMDRNTRTTVVCVPLMVPSTEIVVNVSGEADEFGVDDVLVILEGVGVALPEERVVVVNPRTACELGGEEVSVAI